MLTLDETDDFEVSEVTDIELGCDLAYGLLKSLRPLIISLLEIALMVDGGLA